METPDGRWVNANEATVKTYEDLRKIHLEILGESGTLWNWPSAATLTRPTLARILWLSEIYDLILKIPGSILEFGVHLGTSSAILTNLRAIKEPNNYNRELFVFDTFEGFKGSTDSDGNRGGDGKFSTPKTYELLLDSLLTHHESLTTVRQQSAHKIYKGDASMTVQDFLADNPSTTISLAVFDMDLYAPTRDALTAILPRLMKGSILVFDQFSFSGYPGETIAVSEVLELNNLRLNRSNLMPHCAWVRFGD